MVKYPLSTKLAEASIQYNHVCSFIYWLRSRGYEICELGEPVIVYGDEHDHWLATTKKTLDLFMESIDIDQAALEIERRGMIDRCKNK